MVVKVEIRTHDGPGRITRIHSDDKVYSSPNLLTPVAIPEFHKLINKEQANSEASFKTGLTLGYLPALHKFSKFSSEEEVIQSLKKDYLPNLQSYNFITFPLDKASKFRTTSQYPEFILKTSQTIDRNFAWIYSQADKNTNWSLLQDFSLMIVGDLATIFKNQRQAWSLITDLQKNYPLTLKYAPAIPPVLFPLYTYLGIDFFDSLYGEFLAQNYLFMDENQLIKVESLEKFYPPCLCKACEQKEEFGSVREYLNQHNANVTQMMIRKVHYALDKGTLRDLVKMTVLVDPTSTGLLRIADLDEENNFLQQYNPSSKKGKLLLTSSSDYIRPEIKMFHNRVMERFSIPAWTKIVLLIPCSARKPYSQSKSHKLFASAIKTALRGKRHSVLELIITSPLGVVPRFFEQVYPAGVYDIPVTGNWSDLEQNIVEELLENIFSKLDPSIPIISYLAEPEKSIIQNFAQKHPQYPITILDVTTSETTPESLKILNNYLFPLKDTFDYTNTKDGFELEFFKAMADYQFGKGSGEAIFLPETKIKKGRHYLTAFHGKDQLATLQLGHLSINVLAATRLAQTYDKYRVYFADEELNGSAIYTPGIVKADEQIRPEDDVLVFSQKSGDLLAYGKSHLTGFELEHCTFGLGVSIKKKIKSTSLKG